MKILTIIRHVYLHMKRGNAPGVGAWAPAASRPARPRRPGLEHRPGCGRTPRGPLRPPPTRVIYVKIGYTILMFTIISHRYTYNKGINMLQSYTKKHHDINGPTRR